MTQPRMSNVLARLRRIVGDPLLVRSGTHLVPTLRAREIALAVEKNLAALDEALNHPKAFVPATSNRVFVLAMSDYVSVLLLAGIMAQVERSAPQVSIVVKRIDSASVERWLDDGDCHIAIGFLSHLNDRHHASFLLNDSPVCIARDGNPHIGATLTRELFVHLHHVATAATPSPATLLEQTIDAALAEQGLRRFVAATASTGLALAETVARTDLIATLSWRAATLYARALALKLYDVPLRLSPRDLTMVWHDRDHRDQGHLWLRHMIRAIGRKENARQCPIAASP